MSHKFEVYINNRPYEIRPSMNLAEILTQLEIKKPYSLLFNRTFLPSSQHKKVQLKAEDRIEVISAKYRS